MLAPIFLTALAGTAAALSAPLLKPDPIDYGNWTLRADWSRCPDASLYEVLFQGRFGVKGTSAGKGIVDFKVPVPPYEANVVLQPVGSIGYGSPVAPKMLELVFFDTPDADGNLATATYLPEKPGATSVDAAIAQVAWFTSADQAFMPASELDFDTLQKNETATIGTTVNPSFLRVYYCSYPSI